MPLHLCFRSGHSLTSRILSPSLSLSRSLSLSLSLSHTHTRSGVFNVLDVSGEAESAWTVRWLRKDEPKQTNDTDCGVFVVSFLETLFRRKRATFREVNMVDARPFWAKALEHGDYEETPWETDLPVTRNADNLVWTCDHVFTSDDEDELQLLAEPGTEAAKTRAEAAAEGESEDEGVAIIEVRKRKASSSEDVRPRDEESSSEQPGEPLSLFQFQMAQYYGSRPLLPMSDRILHEAETKKARKADRQRWKEAEEEDKQLARKEKARKELRKSKGEWEK